MDHDDTIVLKQLCKRFDEVTILRNQALDRFTNAEISLDTGISEHKISDKLAWKKQVNALITLHPQYQIIYIDYMKGKQEEKASAHTLKSIEAEINCVKKTIDVTPDYTEHRKDQLE